MPGLAEPYPADLAIPYPEGPLDRGSAFLRPVLAIPGLVLLCLLSGSQGGGLIVIPTALMLAVRRKYPRWWFDFNRELAGFGARVLAFVALMTQQQPATDAPQTVALTLTYPDVERDLRPPLALVKWLLALPHYLVLALLWPAAILCVFWAWLAILFTARYPRWAFTFVLNVARYHLRVGAYAWLLVTDRYPPFALRA